MPRASPATCGPAWHYGPAIASWEMVAPLAISGLGFGLVGSPTIDFVLAEVPKDDVGSASGLLNTAQQLGIALGVVLAGVVFFAQLDSGSGRGVDVVAPQVRTEFTAAGPNSAGPDPLRLQGMRAGQIGRHQPHRDPSELPGDPGFVHPAWKARSGHRNPQRRRQKGQRRELLSRVQTAIARASRSSSR